MPEFTIVLPVYQSEKTLERCLDSILSQRYEDFEVIVIDDGSSDRTADICREYRRADARVIVVTQENAGASSARNRGLALAKGKWIAFIDADDYVAPDYLKKLHDAATGSEADAVFMGYQQVDINGNPIKTCLPPDLSGNKIADARSLSESDMYGYTWIKIFARESMGSLRFRADMSLFEDEVFACEVMKTCRRIAVLKEPVYFYTVGNANALSGRTYQDYCAKSDSVYAAWKSLLEGNALAQEILRSKASAMFSRCVYYGFERDVAVKPFFEELARCSFCDDGYVCHALLDDVKNRRFGRIAGKRMLYRIKNQLAAVLRRGKE